MVIKYWDMFLNDEKASIRITQRNGPKASDSSIRERNTFSFNIGSQETIAGSFLVSIVDSLYEAVLGDETHICAILSFYCNYQVAQGMI